MIADFWSLPWPPIVHEAAYWLRYGDWWWRQHQTQVLIGGGVTVASVVAARFAWARARNHQARDSWGSARWATTGEIARAGLLHTGAGIILGRHGPWYRRQTLCSADDSHVAVFGPTRSGKTWSLIIPSILNWAGSVIALDIKGELHHWTSGWRTLLGPVYRLHPGDPTTHRFDPLALIRDTSEEADTQRLAGALTADPDTRPDQRAEYWRDQVADWLMTLMRYARRQTVFANTLAGLLGFLRTTTNRLQALSGMTTCPDADVQAGARRLLGMQSTRGRIDEIWDGAIRVLALWRDPTVAHATSAMDIPVDRVQQEAHPMTVYLQVTAEDLADRLRGLFRLILDALVGRLMDRPTEAYRQPLLIVLDEVASLGYMRVVETLCSLVAGYGIRVVLAFQSLNQLWSRYGENTSILDNCPIRVIYAPANQRTAQSLSDLLGEATVRTVSRRRSGDRFAVVYDDSGVQESSHRRPLMTAGELLDMAKRHEVIRVANTEQGLKPIFASKLRYRDREFRAKLLPPAV